MKKDNRIPNYDIKFKDGMIMVASDIHFPYQDNAAVQCFLDEIKKRKPDMVVLNGDLLDFYKLSRFTKDPSGKDPAQEIEMCRAFLKKLRSITDAPIYYTIGNHECFDKRTEILTPDNGWVNIKDAVEHQIKYVTSYNVKTGLLETSEVTHYHKSFCSELLSIETCNTKQIVTPNHELVINGNEKVPAYLLDEKDLNKKILPCAKIKSNISTVNYTADEIRLITWICTDGCIVFKKPRIQFKLSYPEKIQTLKELLNKMNIPYTFKKATMSGENRLQPYLIRIYGENAREIIKKYFNSGLKQFPYDFKNLNEDRLKILLETIIQTDGAQKESRIYFYSSNKHNLDIIQEVCVKNNLSCRIDKGRSGFNPFKKTYKAMITNNYSWVKNQNKIEAVPYNDNVYCLTTKLGTLVTRIDGKVAITGNSRLEKYILNQAPMIACLMDNVFQVIKTDDFNIKGCQHLILNDTFVFKHGTRLGNKSGLSAIKELEAHYSSGASGHCFSEDVEVLTQRGWKKIIDVDVEKDLVGTYNKKTGEFEYNEIREKFLYTNYKKMYHIKSQCIDIMTTGEHGFIGYNQKGELKEFTAKELKLMDNINIPLACKRNSTIPLNLLDDELRLLINICADASIEGNSFRFHLKKERKILHLKELLNNLELEYSEKKQVCGTTEIRISTKSSKFYIDNFFETGIKTLPNIIRWASPEQAKIILEEYAITDGCRNKAAKNSYQISTSKKEEVDILQELFVKSGMRTSVLRRKSGNYCITVNLKNETTVKGDEHVSVVPYKGRVSCVSVDNGTLVVRSKGKTIITQNTHRLSRFTTRKSGRRFIWLETGCLCTLDPEYMINPDWEQGFGVVTFKNGKLVNANIVCIQDGKVID